MANKKLGKGLSALLGEDEKEFSELEHGEATKTVAVSRLHPGKYQPRHVFGEDELRDLSESIRAKGVLQPLLVRPHPKQVGEFEIIAGERRWRAAQLAQVHQVPVIVRDFDDRETLEVALIENLQRQDLSPLEEADGYQRLMKEFSHTQEQLARTLGKSRSHVANMLRLLTLPSEVKALLDKGALSAGHARALVGCAHAARLAKEVVNKGLNVRQTETLVKHEETGSRKPAKGTGVKARAGGKDADTLALEHDLANRLGLKVDIDDHGGRGQVVIHYDTLEQLDGVLARLTHAPQDSDQD
ncbi:MAG: ParB/RepB/Spo0J family partition protein [Alphaproteobacteria bacterium]|nr:ParB/RepB/Spo0J family partition protein [Alphaproteobacteria bacterium]